MSKERVVYTEGTAPDGKDEVWEVSVWRNMDFLDRVFVEHLDDVSKIIASRCREGCFVKVFYRGEALCDSNLRSS